MASAPDYSGTVQTSSALSGGSAHLQPEPQSGESVSDVEDFLHGPSAEDCALQGAKPLHTCGPDFSPDAWRGSS
ncbi:hypothetical protein LDENG_00237150 [Lucifuga dentata]|nr:hypothetical protein LDENG_00237150 [Lucifuga dentata]